MLELKCHGASVYTEMNAISKGVSLGLFDESQKKEIEPNEDGTQPYVDLLGRRYASGRSWFVLLTARRIIMTVPKNVRPLISGPFTSGLNLSVHSTRFLYQTQTETWRALTNASPVLPSTAYSYISRAFRQTTPYIIGALRLLAESFPPPELNSKGFALYAEFRPDVDGWGKRGEVRCERILSLRKADRGTISTATVNDEVVKREVSNDFRAAEAGGTQSNTLEHKKARTMTLEEYEAALDLDTTFDDVELNF